MPWGDWQFWVVTLAAIASIVLAARVLIPRKQKSKRTTLTVSVGPRTGRSR